MFKDIKMDTRKKRENTNWQMWRVKKDDFDLESSHFKEGGLHVGTHELIFVLFTTDSVCKVERIDNNYLSFILNNKKTLENLLKKSNNKFLTFCWDRKEIVKYFLSFFFWLNLKQKIAMRTYSDLWSQPMQSRLEIVFETAFSFRKNFYVQKEVNSEEK